MPTYQYACTTCDHRFEAVQAFSDASLTECPACSGVLRKVFSSVGIVFKGSGFYRTDSRSGAGSTVSNDSGSSSAESGSTKTGPKDSGTKGSGTKKEPAAASSSSSGSSSASSSAPAAAASS